MKETERLLKDGEIGKALGVDWDYLTDEVRSDAKNVARAQLEKDDAECTERVKKVFNTTARLGQARREALIKRIGDTWPRRGTFGEPVASSDIVKWWTGIKAALTSKEHTKLSFQEFLVLSVEDRQKLLAEQANNPEIIAYYQTLIHDEETLQDSGRRE